MDKIWIGIKSFFKYIGAATIIGILSLIFMGRLVQPKMTCDEGEDEIAFEVHEDFRNITIKLHPQMVIQFDNYIILSIYLDGYYAEESLSFDKGNQCRTTKCYVDYVGKLQSYMKDDMVRWICLKDSTATEKEISSRLQIYVSTLGGVRYENKEGNEEKRYCLIEKDGFIRDLDDKSEEVQNRLYEARLTLREDLIGMEDEEEIAELVRGVADEVLAIYKQTAD